MADTERKEPQERQVTKHIPAAEGTGGSLIERLSVYCAPEEPPAWEDGEREERLRILPDGYVRRTPYQPRRTPAGYGETRRRRSAGGVLALLFLILLAAALIRSGLVRF